mmetsp:Transcript_26582/g.37420  ORF Transcript_26582/g.37420 Transcript_26582/m.37420 type:complete len:290 (-) Transcript_26582:538-1407(-)
MPKKIGPYVVSTLLGEGRFGKVKLGTHSITNEKVALKIIGVQDSKTLDREISSMQLLEHPNIVRLLDIIEISEKDKICLVMEYMEGGDLYNCIENNAMDERQASHFFYQLLCGVNHCHERGIVHRDLKPENIVLDKTMSTVKITDFGLCNLIESGAFLMSRCGSPLYSSPEILAGKKYGPEVDAWSLGVILYCMLTGYMPWPGTTLEEQVMNAFQGRYAPLESASPECKDALSRLLTTDPKSRATIKEMMDHPWLMQAKLKQLSCVRSSSSDQVQFHGGQESPPSSLDP